MVHRGARSSAETRGMVPTCSNTRMICMRSGYIVRHGHTSGLHAYIPRARGILPQQSSTRRRLRCDKLCADRVLVRSAAREMSIAATAAPVARRVVTLHACRLERQPASEAEPQSGRHGAGSYIRRSSSRTSPAFTLTIAKAGLWRPHRTPAQDSPQCSFRDLLRP